MNKDPNRQIHGIHTINWFRRRVNAKTIEKSVMTLLPNNGLSVNEDVNDPKYKRRNFLDNEKKIINDKFSEIKITPKYFFSHFIIKKIKKLRDIFLEFDEDGSGKI